MSATEQHVTVDKWVMLESIERRNTEPSTLPDLLDLIRLANVVDHDFIARLKGLSPPLREDCSLARTGLDEVAEQLSWERVKADWLPIEQLERLREKQMFVAKQAQRKPV